jgi:Spy/CpxP family protein refolding chaperone
MKSTYKKTLVAICIALFAFATYSWAQAPANDAKKERRIEHCIEKMKKKLNLSDAQVTQIKTIFTENAPQIKADHEKIKAAPKDQREALRANLKNDKQAIKEKLLAVLTPDQRTKAEKFFNRHKEHNEEKK